MAITGIDTIEGKQIIAAGAVSAKSAEMAYNDENGNPITGYLTAVPTGTMNESNFGYDASDNITAYNGSAIGGGSAPTYGYTDNGLISSIDTSGLYATSALEAESANTVKDHGTLGYDLSSYLSQNTSYFYWMPANSPWTTADYATGIFSPLQYATGACLAMNNPATFKGYYKGNEWFIANTVSNVGQMLRGEVHKTRGVHISGATTAGYGFNLGINNVSGINSTGSWKYGHAEDAALRAVSSCDMHESAFEYNAVNEISAYNGSAIAQYGAEKQWLVHDDTLVHAANSAQYALGVNLSAVAQLLGVDRTLLYSGATGISSYNLSEPLSSFNEVEFFTTTNDGYTFSRKFKSEGGSYSVSNNTLAYIGTTLYTYGKYARYNVTNNYTTVERTYVAERMNTNALTANEVAWATQIYGIGRKEV